MEVLKKMETRGSLYKQIKQKLLKFQRIEVKKPRLKNIKKSLQKTKTAIQFRKMLAYFFARANWFIIHSFYTYKRILMQKQEKKNTTKVNFNFNSKNICNT